MDFFHGKLGCCPQVYLFAEALAEGAVKMGMPSALAHSIASQTVLVSFQSQLSCHMCYTCLTQRINEITVLLDTWCGKVMTKNYKLNHVNRKLSFKKKTYNLQHKQ